MTAIAVIVAGATMAALLLLPTRYTAVATLMIDPNRQSTVNGDSETSAAGSSEAVLDSEIQIMTSPMIIDGAVADLGLDRAPEWNQSLRPGASPGQTTGAQEISATVSKAISVKRRALSFLVDVSATSLSAVDAARIANGLVDAYARFNEQRRASLINRETEWLRARLDDLQGRADTAEKAAQDFRITSGLVSTEPVLPSERQNSDLQGILLQARADLAEKQARYSHVTRLTRSGRSAESLANALTSEVIRDLRQREAVLVGRQAEFESSLGPRHPSVEDGRAEIDNVRAQITAEIRRIEDNLRNEVEIAQARLATLEAGVGRMRETLADDSNDQVKLNALERDASVARQVYEEFLGRYHQIDQQTQPPANDVRIVAAAKTPTDPSTPSLLVKIALSILIGGFVGLLAGIVMELTGRRLHTADDVNRKVGADVLASLPLVGKAQLRTLPEDSRNPPAFVVRRPLSQYAESFRVLRRKIAADPNVGRADIVAVTSALANDGKTTTALGLARIAALSGERVLLIDCDVRRPSIGAVLGMAPAVGLVQVLTGHTPWKAAIGQDEPSGAHVLLTADGAVSAELSFADGAMERLLDEVRPLYDLVVLDCPPVLSIAESRTLCALSRTVIVVARSGTTHAGALTAALDEIEFSGGRVAGVALNCLPPPLFGMASYRDALYFGKSKDSYYVN